MTDDSWRTRIGVWPDGKPVRIDVPGPPVPWAVAKAGKSGGRFIPPRQMSQADRIARAWSVARGGYVPCPYGIVFGAEFVMREPKDHFRTGRHSHLRRVGVPDIPTSTPDLSNLFKLAEDALTGVAWEDDKQIVQYDRMQERYGAHPCTTIWVWLAPSRSLGIGPGNERAEDDEDALPALF